MDLLLISVAPVLYPFIYSCAVSNVKKVSLELGGKSPLIIFSDCDMDKAVRMVGSLTGICSSSGFF